MKQTSYIKANDTAHTGHKMCGLVRKLNLDLKYKFEVLHNGSNSGQYHPKTST